MEERKLEASMAAGEFVVPQSVPVPPFSASKTEQIAAFGMYAAAYVYVYWQTYHPGKGWIAAVFTLVYVALTELLHWNSPRQRESWVWLGCMGLILSGILLGSNRVWGFNAPLFLHIFAVWWAVSRSGRLLEGESGHLLPLDVLDGFVMFPFKHFFLRVRTVYFAFTHPRSGKGRVQPETAAWTALAMLSASALFVLSVNLLAGADEGFAWLLSGLTGILRVDWDGRLVIFRFLLSLPVGAYLFGLLAGTGRENVETLRERAENMNKALEHLQKVPGRVWLVLTGLFCLLYLAFFAVQARYLFGAFTRTLPEGFIVSEYARRGFFELCQVMSVNFVLLWLVTRTSREEVRSSAPAKGLCLALLSESFLFAVVAFSKLGLYISCLGFTPLRLQSTWLVCVLAFGCLCAAYSLMRGKKTFRVWMIFGAVTLSLLQLY